MGNTISPSVLQARLSLLNTAVGDEGIRGKLAETFTASKGDLSATVAELQKANVPAEDIRKIQFAHAAALVTGDNAPVVASILALPGVGSMRDFALTHDVQAIAALLPQEGGDTAAAAQQIQNKVFAMEPSAVLQRMATNAELPIPDASLRSGISNFFASNPDFNIRNQSVYQVLQNGKTLDAVDDSQKEAVVNQLKVMQRLQAISESPQTMSKLMGAGITSAHQIANKTETSFLAANSATLGEQEARSVYYHATNVKIRNEQTLQNFSDAVRGTGVASIDGQDTQETRMLQFNKLAKAQGAPITWESLFGNVDLCQCNDCNSVYSQASYYVELLQYLRNNDLDPNNANSNQKGISGTPLEKLFGRRPDLGCLELTCANTNTILPYIDLVNEVMESFVVHLDQFKLTNDKSGDLLTSDVIDVWNTEDETTGELLAQPQHTNYKAYCILKNSVYPFTLPYHQPIDEIRIFLQFLGTSRYELLKTFRANLTDDSGGTPVPLSPPPAPASPASPDLVFLNELALCRAVDAEYLGLTQEQYIILTKQAFWTKAFFDTKGNTLLTTADYQKNIGVKQPWEYYGYASQADMLSTDESSQSGLTFVKAQFLKRTGIQYTDLINLLLTKYINPGYPSGKALTILESIRFSYRYLQTMVDTSSTDPKVRFGKLISFLELVQPVVPLLDALLHPDPCHAVNSDNTIDPSVFEKWVICHFEKVGKLIVLESGDGPYFPIQGQVYSSRDGDYYSGGKSVGTLTEDGRVVDDQNNQIGQVNAQSVLVFSGAASTLNNRTLSIMDGPQLIGYSSSKGVFRITANPFQGAGSQASDSGSGYSMEEYNNIQQNDTGMSRVTWQPPQDTCDISKVRLQHLDGTPCTTDEYDKIQRFIRLWRALGWTIDETDKAVTGLGKYKTGTGDNSGGSTGQENLFGGFSDNCDCDPNEDECGCGCSGGDSGSYYYDITPDLLHQLVAVKQLLGSTGLEVIRLLSFWTNISTLGNPSLYQQLFLTHNMVGIDPVFQPDANGNYLTQAAKITDHIPVIMAALNLKAADIATIMSFAGIPDSLTLANVSALYRNSLLMRALQLKSNELQQVEVLFGDPFKDAVTSYKFFEAWGKMEDAGFGFRQLNYVFSGLDDPKQPLTPKKKTMLVLARTLYDGLNQIDQDNADITSDDQATPDFVQTKAALLYNSDVTSQIMGLLLGTTIYTTNAPVNLVATPAAFTALLTGTLVPKLKYDPVGGAIQVTGILTSAETTTAKALFADPNWGPAFDRVAKQPLYFYRDVVAGIFPPVAPGQPDPAQAILLQGDANIPAAQQDPSNPIPDTAPIKLAYFIRAFMPYLRGQLENKFINDTISGQAGLASDVCSSLLTDVLLDGSPTAPIIETFRGIKSKPAVTSPWTGYLVPTAEDVYTFAITVTTPALGASVQINGNTIAFTQQADPNNVWLSDPVKLKAGYAYPIVVTGLSADLHELSWKTPITAKTPVPPSVLFPDDSTNTVQEAYVRVQKAAILVNGFNLTAAEVEYFQQNGGDFSGLDFNAFTLAHWKQLDAYTRLRNSLTPSDTDLLTFFTWVRQAKDATQLDKQIAALTGWDQSDIDKLIAPAHFHLGLADFRNANQLLRLQNALYVAGKISMDINLLFDWAEPSSKFWLCQEIARNIRITTKARYKETDWEQVVAPLNNQLREDQRDALIAWLLVQPGLIEWGVEDADSLFEFFLIDVQMDACMQTSRIKQAINSVQLFVQRCFLGLEEPYGVGPNVLDRGRWEWMQREVLWVANRKVFLYPENWIEESLRDDSTDIFKELSAELLQKDINASNVEDALKNYLFKLDEVADMNAVGLFNDTANNRVHVFSRTRNAPYFFYYRYYDTNLTTWTAWSKMEVDITCYDKQDSSGQIQANGCYLIPAVFDNRLLVFFPQFLQKTIPPGNSGSMDASDNKHIPTPGPTYRWEIKMAWSELRNGKWTQKQVSKDAIYDPSSPSSSLPDISSYDFVPVVTTSSRQITLNAFSGKNPIGAFLFSGSQLYVTGSMSLTGASELPGDFHYADSGSTRTIQSLQIVDGTAIPAQDTEPYVEEGLHAQGTFSYQGDYEFYHPYTHQLLGRTETGDLVDFFECAPNIQAAGDEISKLPAGSVSDADMMFGAFPLQNNGTIYDELAAPYSLYNWELFFHIPATLAGNLSAAQSFENAMSWYHYVFNPSAPGKDAQRCWRFWPFRQSNAQNYLENLFNGLQPNTPDAANGQINAWRDNPFQPHMIARLRPSAYMKWIVMKYLDNLIAWGDYLFTQHTIESINQATQLYILASHILGPQPEMIPPRGKIKPETYNSLLNKWDAFGNAMVEMELVFPYSNQVTEPILKYDGVSAGLANIYGFATTLYFCIPDNPNLLQYWDVVADRLYKIRHCENIEGVFSLPPLWDPPIDPGLLVNAVAQGVSISSVLNDLSTPLPNYRFSYLVQKSLELCGELKSMGGSLLSAFEKKDGEALATLRANHEVTINNLVMQVKTQQLDEANKSLDSLQQNRLAPVMRLQHYLNLIGADPSSVPDASTDFTPVPDVVVPPVSDSGLLLVPYEKEEMDKAGKTADMQVAIGVVETLGSILNLIPNFAADVKPLGVGAGLTFGGVNLGNALAAVGRGMQIGANYLSYQSSNAQRKGGFLRQLQDRVLQANNAGYEIKQIDKQILSQQVRIQIANQEITNQQKQIDNSGEVLDFLTNKYTNEDLYTWMRDTTKTLYYQVYTLAYSLAKKAEMVYRYDRGLSSSNFIQFGYWDAGHDGLLAGEQLFVGIKQLEAAYQQDRGYDFEVTKHISLRQINPLALLQLRETGTCSFELPEVLFDMDFPGHYMRRIRSVGLSIPCIVGPYTSINATLRMQSNTFRASPIAQDKNAYPQTTDQEDDRFITANTPITAIAVSSGQNDNGVFELNFKDERYMPFEGAGAISTWTLSLPAGFRQFDYRSITDVVMHLRYTSLDGGDKLGAVASGALTAYMNSVEDLSQQEGLFTVFDVVHDFPNEWYKAMQMPLPAGATARTLTLPNLADRLPVFTRSFKVTGVDVYVLTSAGLQAGKLTLTADGNDNSFTAGVKFGTWNAFAVEDTQMTVANWVLTINDTTTPVNDMWIVARYTMK